MKNLKKAAEKIKKAESIVIYTDSDLDGITSGLIAQKTLSSLGKEASIFFTNKEDRGYGLGLKSVEMISEKAPDSKLLITMDCGISDFAGVKRARELGFEVVILDHHKPHEKVPEADLIVCPKLHDDKFKERPNAGIILELSELLLGQRKEEFIELTALAIFGDMMPHEGPNKEVLDQFKDNFPATSGVSVFVDIFNMNQPFLLFQEIFPILNVTEMREGVPESFIYFRENNRQKNLAKKMIDDYRKRKEKVEKIKLKILKENGDGQLIFKGSREWPSFILGKIASQLVSEIDKPVFIYRIKDDIAQGSVRVPRGVDAVEAMKGSEDILENYGGHPPAAGFTIKEENLEEFKKDLIKYFKNR